MSETPATFPYYPIDTHQRVLGVVQHCEAVCENTFTAVLGMLGMRDVHTRVMQLQLLRDCADICTLTAKYIARSSMYSRSLAGLCAEVCEMCGNHCSNMPDPQSQFCGQVCLDCAKECRAYAGMSMPYPGMSPGQWMPGMYSQPEKKDEKK